MDRMILIISLNSLQVGIETSVNLAKIVLNQTLLELVEDHVYWIIYYVVISIHFILPSFITFVCMLIQARSIRSSLAPSQESNSSEPSASHANMTIFMITALFCFCHLPYCLYLFYLTYVYIFGANFKKVSYIEHYQVFICFMEFSLPLLNSALFPLIIILRKQSLRERYRDFFLRVSVTMRSGVGVVVRKCGGVVRWVGGIGRRADYEELSGVEES